MLFLARYGVYEKQNLRGMCQDNLSLMNHYRPAEDFEWSCVPTPGPRTAWPEKAVTLTTEPTPSFSEQPLKATRGCIRHHRLGLGFLLLLPSITEFICTLDPSLLLSTFSLLSEKCDYLLDYSPKTASFLLSEGLYRGSET